MNRRRLTGAKEIRVTRAARNAVLIVLGWGFVALGVVGVILPVLPTTPFMLIALWCFARSSKRFHDWLYHHRLFGPPLRKWDRYGVIPVSAKVFACTAMSASLIYIVFFRDLPVYLVALTAAVMAYGAWFILTKPSHVPTDGESA
ncbi:YbaN family protein [bacterium SCSIO 12827]|nr:YbaN family protein [bacterium SCSIO 12827]